MVVVVVMEQGGNGGGDVGGREDGGGFFHVRVVMGLWVVVGAGWGFSLVAGASGLGAMMVVVVVMVKPMPKKNVIRKKTKEINDTRENET